MNKLIILMLILVLATASVIAASETYNNIDEECQDFGYSFGVAKWVWNDAQESWELDEELTGYNTSVNGSPQTAEWTSEPGVSGILTKEGCNYQVTIGGNTGTVNKYDESNMEHLTMCADSDEEVPEFGTIAATLALLGAIGVFAISRRARK